jgi:hypothetical protein
VVLFFNFVGNFCDLTFPVSFISYKPLLKLISLLVFFFSFLIFSSLLLIIKKLFVERPLDWIPFCSKKLLYKIQTSVKISLEV